MKTGLIWDELYMWHDTGSRAGLFTPGLTVEPGQHFENPNTKRRLKNLLDVSGLSKQLVMVAPRKATDEEILRAHDGDYIDKVRQLSEAAGGEAGPFAPFGPGGFEIAKLSAGGVIAGVDAILNGEIDNAYALVRPPGHHAMPDSGLGFCILGNAAIAGFHALQKRGLTRIAFIDWDVHHGNGTETMFYRDPRALTISLHQDRFFPPDSGLLEDNGDGDGKGYNINIPLPPGSGVGAYQAAFDRVVIPALEIYQPELIITPCGFDGCGIDPLGRMLLHSECYSSLTQQLMRIADKVCNGRLLLCHEGGYNEAIVPYLGLAVLEALSETDTDIEDPFLPIIAGMGGQALQLHQEQVINQAGELLERIQI